MDVLYGLLNAQNKQASKQSALVALEALPCVRTTNMCVWDSFNIHKARTCHRKKEGTISSEYNWFSAAYAFDVLVLQ